MNRNETIDCLRAVAALSVFSFHTWGHSTHIKHHWPFSLGAFGVFLFFLISGYCIVLSLDKLEDGAVKKFLIRRAFRLYPVYWISLLLCATIWKAPLTTVLCNITMFQVAFGVDNVLGTYWTLFVELIFYAIITLLLIAGLVKKPSTYALMTIFFMMASFAAVLLRIWTGFQVPYAYLMMLALFTLGGFTSMKMRGQNDNRMVLFLIAITLFILNYIITILLGGIGIQPIDIAVNSYNIFGALLVFYFALNVKFLDWSWLAYIGRISYCVYLFREAIGFIVNQYISGIEFAFILTLLLTLIVSAWIHKFIELPCIRIGKRLVKQLTSASAPLGQTLEL